MIDVMGVDPSLTHSGLCLPDGSTVSIKTGGANVGDKRLGIIRRELSHQLRLWPIRYAVLEDIPFSSKGNTAGAAFGHAIIRDVLADFGIPVGLIVPATLKMFATGAGNADKVAMVAAANRQRSEHARLTGKLDHYADLTDDNEADAWWLRQMGLWLAKADELDSNVDEFIGAAAVRDKCCYGPWRKAPGAKWPDRVRVAAAATQM
jgi:Holliday junction resolvasome RuvABC endonuclease subunit